MINVTNEEIIERWLSAFAQNVPIKIVKEYITKSCNFLWHIFTWGKVPCMSGDDARKAFDALAYDKAIMFKNGYSENDEPKIEDVQLHGKIFSVVLDDIDDVYIVDENFQWTYVHTHESSCGPYFCCRSK